MTIYKYKACTNRLRFRKMWSCRVSMPWTVRGRDRHHKPAPSCGRSCRRKWSFRETPPTTVQLRSQREEAQEAPRSLPAIKTKMTKYWLTSMSFLQRSTRNLNKASLIAWTTQKRTLPKTQQTRATPTRIRRCLIILMIKYCKRNSRTSQSKLSMIHIAWVLLMYPFQEESGHHQFLLTNKLNPSIKERKSCGRIRQQLIFTKLRSEMVEITKRSGHRGKLMRAMGKAMLWSRRYQVKLRPRSPKPNNYKRKHNMLRSKHSHRFRSSSQSRNSMPSSERSSSKKRKRRTCWQSRRLQPRQMPELQYLLESLRMLKKPKQLPQSKKWKDLSRAKRNPQQISNKKETSLKKESHRNPRLTSSKLSMIHKCRWRIRTRKGGSSLKKQKEWPCWTQELQQQQEVDPRNNLLVKRRRRMTWSCSQSKLFLRWVSPRPYPSKTKWLHQLSQETIENHIFSLHQPTRQRARLFSKTSAQSRDKTQIHQAYMTHQIHLRVKTTDEQATQSTPTTKTKASLSRGNHSFPLKTITRLIFLVTKATSVIWITLVRTWIARTHSLTSYLSKIKPRFQLKYLLTSYGLLCSRIKFLWIQMLLSKTQLKIKVLIKVQQLMWPSWFHSSNSNQNRAITINNRSKTSGRLMLPIIIWTMARIQISISFPTNNSFLNIPRPIRCLKDSPSIICKLVKETITSMGLTTSRIAWQICPICQTSWDLARWGTQTAPRVVMALELDSCFQTPINWTPCRTCCLKTTVK